MNFRRTSSLASMLLVFALTGIGIVPSAHSQSLQYTYDSLDRLTSVQYPDRLVRYTYDPAGNRLILSIEPINPAPTITALSPASALVGGPTFSISVTGTGFVGSSSVRLNGAPRPTTLVSSSQLSVAIGAADVAALGTAQVTVTNPAPGGGVSSALPFSIVAACTVAVSPTSQAVPAAGGANTVAVTAPAGCAWDVSANRPWLSITSNASGAGSGSVGYSVAPNASSLSRSGHVTVAGEVLTLTQAGAACTLTVAASPSSFTATGGAGVATITATPNDCSWTALGSAPWITVTGVSAGAGNGTVTFAVAANTSTSARAGSLSAGGQAAAISQDGRLVVLTVTTAGTGTGSVVSAPAGIDCGATCSAGFVAGQQVTLTATPAPGSTFDQWTGDADCTDGAVTLDADLQCTAGFLSDTVGNPVPFVTVVSPLSVAPAPAALTLTVRGANFLPSSVVRWNGTDLVPVAVTSTRIDATVAAANLVAGTTATVTVWTPGPGGGVSNEALVHVTTPNPQVEFGLSTAATAASPVGVIAADLNADGQPDLVSANLQASSVSVLLATGSGTFAARTDYATGGTPSAVLAADLNGDARLDLVTTNYSANTISVLLGNGDGTFGPAADVVAGAGPFTAAAADLDADGALDVVVAVGAPTAMAVLRGNGDGTFRAAVSYGMPSTPQGLVVADVDTDGVLDVAAAGVSATVSVFLGAGDGTLGAPSSFAAGNGARGMAAGDLNSDGLLDLLVTNETDGTVSVLLGDGAGGFGPKVDVPVGAGPRAVVLGDLDADASLDAAVATSGAGLVSLLLGNGDGTFAPKRDVVAGAGPVSLARSDVDRDGRLDLVVANQAANTLTILAGRLPAGLVLSPPAIDFGQRAIGVPTTSRDISITNTGASPLVVSGVSLVAGAVAQFEVTADTCSSSAVAPNTTCIVSVRFLASAPGVSTASLQVASNAPGGPHLVTLTGEAVQGAAISGFTPASGGAGTTVTITGTALGAATAVEFNGLAAQFTVTNSTTVVATVPVGATSGPIAVTTPLNVATSAAAFRVAPRITSLSPGFGAPGMAVTIAGANFEGASSVRFDGVTAPFAVNSAAQITATVPALATTGPVTVTTPAGTASSAATFVVAPRVSGFAPASGPAGTTVTIDGANFTGATTVTFNGRAATFTVVSPTRVSASVPSLGTSGPIAVTTAAGTGVSPGAFTVTFEPVVTSFSPIRGPSGTAVTITGADFDNVRAVRFNGTRASYVVTSSTQVVATVPAGATSGPISVTTTVGTGTSVESFLLAPSISSVTPAAGPVGTSVTIRGASFTGAVAVTFNGTPAMFTVLSPTRISTQVPSDASTGAVAVTTPGGVATSASLFAVQATIGGLSPTSGDVGTVVQISGSAFTGATAVTFNGLPATYVVNSASAITATVPAAGITGAISVTTPAGTATSANAFVVSPRITGFTPTSGRAGTRVTITGANFSGATAVTFNGVAATFLVNSATQITARVPAGATAGPIVVTTPAGTATGPGIFTP